MASTFSFPYSPREVQSKWTKLHVAALLQIGLLLTSTTQSLPSTPNMRVTSLPSSSRRSPSRSTTELLSSRSSQSRSSNAPALLLMSSYPWLLLRCAPTLSCTTVTTSGRIPTPLRRSISVRALLPRFWLTLLCTFRV